MASGFSEYILAGLNFSSADYQILGFLKENLGLLQPKKVFFTHIRSNIFGTENDREDLIAGLEDRVNTFFQEFAFSYELLLIEGQPDDHLREWSRQNRIDLLMLGRHDRPDHAVDVGNLIKKPGKSLLLTPSKPVSKVRRICVPFDFTAVSLHALQYALEMAARGSAEVLGLHCFQVPTGYHTSGKSREEFASIMEKNAREEAENLFENASLQNIQMHYRYDRTNQPSACISRFLSDENADMVIMGSKGRTGAASLLSGSVAKKTIGRIYDIPMLIVKENNEVMDITEAIKQL